MRAKPTRRVLALAAILAALPAACSREASARGAAPSTAFDRAAVLANRPELELPRTADYDFDPPEPGSYRLPAIKPAADGRVLGPSGEPARLRALMAGRICILSFIYTRCADPRACPRASGVLHELHRISRQDPILADNLRLITMSFDPAHDTPERMAAYGRSLGSQEPGAEWLFLTARTREQLAPILGAYGQQVRRKSDPNDPLGPFNHQLRIYLIDRAGQIRNIYAFGLIDPRMLATDIRTLLLEEIAREQ